MLVILTIRIDLLTDDYFILLDKIGFDFKQKYNTNGWKNANILHIACNNVNVIAVKWILSNGIVDNVNIADDDGDTALHYLMYGIDFHQMETKYVFNKLTEIIMLCIVERVDENQPILPL